MLDRVPLWLSIAPKHAGFQVVGDIEEKSAIHVARTFMERKRNYVEQHFWARVLCFDDRSGRDGDQRVHPAPGKGGRASSLRG